MRKNYSTSAFISSIILFSLLIYSLFQNDIVFVTITSTFLIILVILSYKKWLNPEFFLLLPLVPIIYFIGSILDLFIEDLEYDGLLHFYASFTITYLFGSLRKKMPVINLKKENLIFYLLIIIFGITTGIFWEIFEAWADKFFPEYLKGGIEDVFSDLIFDILGIILSVLFIFKEKD